MDTLLRAAKSALDYVRANPTYFRTQVQTHIQLSVLAILIGLAIAFPLGVLASRNRYVSLYSLNGVGVVRAIPSIAILFVAYPYLGTGFKPALVALAALAAPPILINTNVGLRGIDPALRDAAYGMGMTTPQVLRRIEFPLALPVILAGLRTATVEVIASATLAAYIGANGLGLFIYQGLSVGGLPEILVGAIPVTLLTLGAELILGAGERFSRRLTGQQV